MELLDREISHVAHGGQGHLIFKVNGLTDARIVDLLYRASNAGVRIDLLVREMCILRPGVPGLSENIRVLSVVGRFLEHHRIYYFRNGGAEEVYLGSADLMPRNLDRRVELIFPIEDESWLAYLRDDVLRLYLRDTSRSHELRPDGSYARCTRRRGSRRWTPRKCCSPPHASARDGKVVPAWCVCSPCPASPRWSRGSIWWLPSSRPSAPTASGRNPATSWWSRPRS